MVISPTDVWAVGTHDHRRFPHASTLYASHWDGTAWTTYPTPNPGQFFNQVWDIDAISSTDVWAVGSYSDIADGPSHTLVLHWDGATWSESSSRDVGTAGSSLSGVTAISPSDIWAVGSVSEGEAFQGTSLTEHWDGQRWRVVRSPNVTGADGTFLAAVTAVTSDDVWAVGSSHTPGLAEPVAVHWNGSKWKIEPTDDPDHYGGYLTSVYAAAPDDVWAVGTNYHVYQHVLFEHWDGIRWTAVDAPTPGKATFTNSIEGTSSTDIWAVGQEWAKGRSEDPLLIEHWDGTAWTDASIYDRPGGQNGYLFGVSTDASDDAWAVGQEYDPAAGHGEGRTVQVRLHWDGNAWS